MLDIILKKHPKSPISEAYRTLRTNIQFASFDKEVKVILVTSSGPSEGKTTTASNLAYTLSETSKKVLLVDCDLRKPKIHKIFKISNQTGLSNILIEDYDLSTAIKKADNNLYVLTAGTLPPNPVEMISSKKMSDFIEKVKDEYDYIILDTPPVVSVTDAQILSTMADGVILVVSSGEANKEAAIRAKELLLNVNAKILGVVLNKLDIASKGGYGYRYYYYYSEDEGKRKRK
ncbi:capsular exopolysaccharide family [Caloramator quimbayensis]|uniref:non-specific protein-tyrosine kinase n=1 Tax=Caloramator quimbayensis TaxID=1147123 RepID=A0A1T4XGH9_9CLOT|nr:CpsD/CapB family tyrosine-protein kinase [Caloramator quimbayensis]SKA88654.1 capsular exopolysaccharide family [Caloramator quimbayensis]